eukprot:1195552-Prorocentrum_minimum.AAC.2
MSTLGVINTRHVYAAPMTYWLNSKHNAGLRCSVASRRPRRQTPTLRVYTLFPHTIGSRCGYIPFSLTPLAHAAGIHPFCLIQNMSKQCS